MAQFTAAFYNWCELPVELDIRPFLQAEIGRSLTATGSGSGSDVRSLVDAMWRMLAPSRPNGDSKTAEGTMVGIDGLLLARFLADPKSEE